MENTEATAKGLNFEIRKTGYFKEEYFKVNMPLKLCLRHGHDLAGFFKTEFLGIIEIQNTVERFEEPEAGRTVDVFGKRLVPVDIAGEIAKEVAAAVSVLHTPETETPEEEAKLIEKAPETTTQEQEPVIVDNNPSLAALLGGLQAVAPVAPPVVVPVVIPVKTKKVRRAVNNDPR